MGATAAMLQYCNTEGGSPGSRGRGPEEVRKQNQNYNGNGCGRVGGLCALAPKWQTHDPIAVLLLALWLLLS